MTLSPVVDALLKIFEEQKPVAKNAAKYAVSRTVSLLAVLYEKARNAVEFRAEHLVRRAAIGRILKRRILINGGSSNIAENLILELLWARYIDSSLIDEAKVSEIQKILDRYMTVKQELTRLPQAQHISWQTMLDLASAEIDEKIVTAKKRDALNDFVYQCMRPKIIIPDMEESQINLLTFIAVERAFAQADNELITFDLLKVIQPNWLDLPAEKVNTELSALLKNLQLIKAGLTNAKGEGIYHFIRKRTPPFLLIRDFLLETGAEARALIGNQEELESKFHQIADSRYKETGAKVKTAIVRSFIYIFLTKMVFAFALEAPFDLWITKKLDYLPLAVNMLFPPVLMIMVAGLFTVPGEENTKRLIERIVRIIYHFEDFISDNDVFTTKKLTKRPVLTGIFSLIYLTTFLLSFGLIAFILTKLHFNIASQTIFIFFVCLVSFFAYRIQQSAKEYEIEERQQFLGPFVDFFFLPILRAGRFLSREIARLNVLIFFFDFILEAPLKVIFEVFEEWIRFIRTKKDEII